MLPGSLALLFVFAWGEEEEGEKGMPSVDDQRIQTWRRKLDPEMGNGNSIGRTDGWITKGNGMDGWTGGQTKSNSRTLRELAGWLLAPWEYLFRGRELGGARQAFTEAFTDRGY